MAQSSAKTQTTWDSILGEIRKSVNPYRFNTWLRPTRQEGLAEGTLVISVPNAELQQVNEKFRPQIDQAIHRLHLDGTVQRVEVVVAAAAAAIAAVAAPVTPERPEQRKLEFDTGTLKPEYTFETFVVGGSNQFAHAAAQACAERPGRAYNPLFLYGGVGMGKTHLMHAIGHRTKELGRPVRIEYVTAEDFTNEMITALRHDNMGGFRDRYRSVDVLLIDDIQFIANKERIQEEFFHTFNALHGAGKQVVVSSDRPPRELVQLEERMRSRFEWGLSADLQPPDLETRTAILMEKAQLERRKHPGALELSADVAGFIASKIKSNVRELEGAMVRLLAYCTLKGLPVTIPTAQEALKNLLDQQQRKLDIEIIAKAVAEAFNLRVLDLKARNNSQQIVVPRQVAMYLTRQLLGISLPEIARYFGGKHHSTVIHSIRKIEQERLTNQALARTLAHLTEQLQ
ncbi:MAG: chromosomal replication initiator protein DnaA [Acidobacteria bacterium]|nr:MAG: chromosomal replication initiator protein DnaA [Acidobacteriota bacterium]